MPSAEGAFPVRYLGVPLISTRLIYRDCKTLGEKLESKVNDWRNKFLSFAGHLQLIWSVFSSMHIYWASVFILPTRVVHELVQLMCGFLWCQGEMKKEKVKVSWDSVCMPKHEGGLGIRRIDDFNLKDMLSNRDIARSGFSLDDSISNLISDGVWRWPPNWLSRFPSMAQLHFPLLLDDIDDVTLWQNRDGVLCCLSSMLAFRYDSGLRKIWFNARQWDVGPSIDLNLLRCPLSDLVPDSHDHLFFECSFSTYVWSKDRGCCYLILHLAGKEWKIVQEEDFVSGSYCSSYFIYGAVKVGHIQVQEDVYPVLFAA
ncbi:hypothetical protein Tco_0163028 [Tanacetum coccineum]